jgi:hypothetical protein
MIYNYRELRPFVFTEDGQVLFLKIRDKAAELIKSAGCVMSGKLLCFSGDVWHMLACIDRLVELGEIVEVTRGNVAGQHRIFVKGRGND